jgi:hypothetical protein
MVNPLAKGVGVEASHARSSVSLKHRLAMKLSGFLMLMSVWVNR